MSDIKNLNLSENPLQSLAATNCTSDVRMYTVLYEFVHFSKGEYNEITRESQRIYRQMRCSTFC